MDPMPSSPDQDPVGRDQGELVIRPRRINMMAPHAAIGGAGMPPFCKAENTRTAKAEISSIMLAAMRNPVSR